MKEIIGEIIVASAAAIAPAALFKINDVFRSARQYPKEVKDSEYINEYVKPALSHYFLSLFACIIFSIIFLNDANSTRTSDYNQLPDFYYVLVGVLFLLVIIYFLFFIEKINNILQIKAPKLRTLLLNRKILFYPYIFFPFSSLINERVINLITWNEFIFKTILVIMFIPYIYHILYHTRTGYRKLKQITIKFANSSNEHLIEKDNLIDYKIKNGKINVRYKENNTIKLCIYREEHAEKIEITYE